MREDEKRLLNRVQRAHTRHPGSTAKELARYTGLSSSAVNRVLYRRRDVFDQLDDPQLGWYVAANADTRDEAEQRELSEREQGLLDEYGVNYLYSLQHR